MAEVLNFFELRTRPQFRQMERYLRACLPDHPRAPDLPSLRAAFAAQDDVTEVDLPPAMEWPITDIAPEPDASGTDTKVFEGRITPGLIEDLICVWMLSVAQERSETALLGAGGLYRLNIPASACVSAGSLETVLNHPDMRKAWGPAEAHVSVKVPLEIISISPGETAKAAGTEGGRSKQVARIQDKLIEGKRIYLCCSSADAVPLDLSAWVLHSFDLPNLDFDLIYALHCLLYPKRPRPTADAFTSVTSLAGLSVADLALSLCYDETLPAAELLTRLVESRQSLAQSVDRGPDLEDVVGNKPAVDLANQIKRDVEIWQAGHILWSEVTNGSLFSGPPGCGKTMFASAMARSLGAEFFKVSYADCAADHNRGSNGIIEQLFKLGRKAAASKRAVLFLDEIDGFGLSRFAARDHNSSYFRVITTGLLRFCDDMRKAEGVILIAATNDVDAVDPALIRAGRFDHHIRLTRPKLIDIQTLLARELPAVSEPDITSAAKRLLGSSFAEIAAAVRSIKAQARAQQRPPHDTELRAVLDQLVPDSAESETDLQRIALHESGHVLVSFLQSNIVPSRAVLSHLRSHITLSTPLNFTKARLNDELTMLLAGRAAERLVLGDIGSGSGADVDSDLARATHLALSAKCHWHLAVDSDLIWQEVSLKPSPLIDHQLRKEISYLLRARERAATDLLFRHKSALLKFAEKLLDVREMDRSEIQTLLRELIPDSAEPGQPTTDPTPQPDSQTQPDSL